MKAILDTCIVVDVLQKREPFFEDAKKVFLKCADQEYEGFLTAKSITDIYYLTHRLTHSNKYTREILKKLCALFYILDTSALDIRKALFSDVADFEDGVMIETALRSGIECIVTRNTKDYGKSPIPIYTPLEFIELLGKDK